MSHYKMKKGDKSGLSIPKSRMVCGYKIKKMPIGAYLKALDTLSAAPEDFFEQCFPGQKPGEILDNLIKLDKNGLSLIIAGLFTSAPHYIINLISDVTGIDTDALINDENIGIDGLLSIIDAFIEVNSLGELPSAVNALKAKLNLLTKPKLNGGFND